MPREFDESKDKTLWTETLGSGLELSVKAYNGGKPKLHIGPRWREREGERLAAKPGRLSFEEVEDLLAYGHDILKAMK